MSTLLRRGAGAGAGLFEANCVRRARIRYMERGRPVRLGRCGPGALERHKLPARSVCGQDRRPPGSRRVQCGVRDVRLFVGSHSGDSGRVAGRPAQCGIGRGVARRRQGFGRNRADTRNGRRDLVVSLRAGASEGPSRSVLTVVGLLLPFLLVQDVWRFAFFAAGRGSAAFLNDVTWALAMGAAFALLRPSDVTWFVFGWAAAGALAAIVGVFQLKVLPSGPVAAVRWLSRHRDIAPRFFAEFGVGTGVSNLTFVAIGGVAGLGELGRLRAGEIAISPLNVLFPGVALAATPEGVRWLRRISETTGFRVCLAFSCIVGQRPGVGHAYSGRTPRCR